MACTGTVAARLQAGCCPCLLPRSLYVASTGVRGRGALQRRAMRACMLTSHPRQPAASLGGSASVRLVCTRLRDSLVAGGGQRRDGGALGACPSGPREERLTATHSPSRPRSAGELGAGTRGRAATASNRGGASARAGTAAIPPPGPPGGGGGPGGRGGGGGGASAPRPRTLLKLRSQPLGFPSFIHSI